MFRKRLNGEYLSWYLSSPHKNRIDHVGEALLNKGYRPAVIQNHLLEWIRLSRYLSTRNCPIPSNIFSKEIKEYLGKRFPEGSETRRRGIRAAIRIFLETDNAGDFPRRMKIPKPKPSFLYQQWVPQYLYYLRQHRNLSESTLRNRERFLKKFTDFFEKSDVRYAKDISPQVILDSLKDLPGWDQSMRLGYASALRSFLRWGYSEGFFPTDLSCAVITARRYRDAKIPDLLSDEEIEKLLGSIDRKTPLGKRDFAILLLAARYGLRPGDIRQLSLEDIKWRDGLISITQSKTGGSLVLPLLGDVSAALIEYLQNGRPHTESRKVFVRHVAPYEPFSKDNNLAVIMKKALVQAGMANKKGLKGLYLLRHSLATRLLREGNSVKAIADVLGHDDITSTFIYSKVNLGELRTVAISIKEVLS